MQSPFTLTPGLQNFTKLMKKMTPVRHLSMRAAILGTGS